MLRKEILLSALVCAAAPFSGSGAAQAQSMPMPTPVKSDTTKARPMSTPRDTAPLRDSALPRKVSADEMMIGPLGISMDRMGSGTTWIPDAVPMPSRRTMAGSWMLMAHGFAFAQYDHQSGTRGADQLGSLNWGMLMATKNVAGGRFQARTMLSLDALGVTSRGYPLLLQNGETFKGVPLHDRQHPHDFWMELGALYQRQFSPRLGWSIYAAPSGEPALGPVAFMHRPSAMDNPTAPLGHHWQDATHVSFGVVTAGAFGKNFQVEGSAFNGREPDDRRWNFDPIKLDSYSARVTFNPGPSWSASAGYGYLKSPEATHPRESLHRVTASLLNGRVIGKDGSLATALIWGANKHSSAASLAHSVLFESEAVLSSGNSLFFRGEAVQKTTEDLSLEINGDGAASGFPEARRFTVQSAQLGYVREIVRWSAATLGAGGAGTLDFVPGALRQFYGTRNPTGLLVFLRVRPVRMPNSTAPMSGMTMER